MAKCIFLSLGVFQCRVIRSLNRFCVTAGYLESDFWTVHLFSGWTIQTHQLGESEWSVRIKDSSLHLCPFLFFPSISIFHSILPCLHVSVCLQWCEPADRIDCVLQNKFAGTECSYLMTWVAERGFWPTYSRKQPIDEEVCVCVFTIRLKVFTIKSIRWKNPTMKSYNGGTQAWLSQRLDSTDRSICLNPSDYLDNCMFLF